MTLREIVYMISDELKLMSDDSSFNEEHIKFLVNKHRVLVLNQQYNKTLDTVHESNFQLIKITLEEFVNNTRYAKKRKYLKSKNIVPHTILRGDKVFPINSAYNYIFTKVNKERMGFIGFNKWLSNIIYWAISESYLYLYSDSESLKYLTESGNKKEEPKQEPKEKPKEDYKVYMYGVFEDAEKAFVLEDSTEDIMDREYPLESGLVPVLIQSVIQELAAKIVQPEDSYNNASDDKANLARYLALNTKSDLAKQLS